MNMWIALLRGVNVGGNKKLPMAEFRDMLTGLGFGDVATYIQSGNAVFSTDGDPATLAAMIEAAIAARCGFHSDTFVMPISRMTDALAANPYPQAHEDPKSLHLIFLAQADQDLDHAAMQALLLAGQEYDLRAGVLYLFSPDGLSKCPLADKLPLFIDGSMTARNLRSCLKITELAQAV